MLNMRLATWLHLATHLDKAKSKRMTHTPTGLSLNGRGASRPADELAAPILPARQGHADWKREKFSSFGKSKPANSYLSDCFCTYSYSQQYIIQNDTLLMLRRSTCNQSLPEDLKP